MYTKLVQMLLGPDDVDAMDKARAADDATHDPHGTVGAWVQVAQPSLRILIERSTADLLLANAPGLSALLVLGGVITLHPNGRYVFNAGLLHKWLTGQPFGTNPARPFDRGANPGMLGALALLWPRTLHALANGDLTIANLVVPRPAPLSSWVSFTVPRGVSDYYVNTAGDPLPSSITAAFKIEPPAAGGGPVFEGWLYSTDPQPVAVDLGDHWMLRVAPSPTFGVRHDDAGWHGSFDPTGAGAPPPGQPTSVRISREAPGGEPDLVIGPAADLHLAVRDIAAWMNVRELEPGAANGLPTVELGAHAADVRFVIGPRVLGPFGDSGADGQPKYMMLEGSGRGIELNWDNLHGTRAIVDGRVEFLWAMEQEWNVVSGLRVVFHSLRAFLEVKYPQADHVGGTWFVARAGAALHFSVTVNGMLTLIVDGVGIWFGWWMDDVGKFFMDLLGVKQSAFDTPTPIGLLPPRGAGIEARYDGVKLGGFLGYENGRFSGLASLDVYNRFSLDVYGVYENLPNGDPSLVAAGSLHFTPAIPLGFGFFIDAFGGLFAINRRLDSDALRLRITTGVAGNILFAAAGVAEAPKILGDLEAVFPPAKNVHVFGASHRVIWGGGILQIEAGLYAEIAADSGEYGMSGLTDLTLLGSSRLTIPPGDTGETKQSNVSVNQWGRDPTPGSILKLRSDLRATVNLVKKTIELESVLIDSWILRMFQVTGDAAFRASWGSRQDVLLSVGGFHPDYHPQPVMPTLSRVGIRFSAENAAGKVALQLSGYFAITSNSVQLGARFDASLTVADVFTASGAIQFDAMLEWNPFHFSVGLSGGISVSAFGVNLAGVTLEGRLSGPNPFALYGRFTIQLLFFPFTWEDTYYFGDPQQQVTVPIASAVQALAEELTNAHNLAPTAPSDSYVALNGAAGIVSPAGGVRWLERRCPLDTLLERFEGNPLATPQRIALTVRRAGNPNPIDGTTFEDWFAPGGFMKLSQSEALNRASFERLPAGIELAFAHERAGGVEVDRIVIPLILPDATEVPSLAPLSVPDAVLDASARRIARATDFPAGAPQVVVRDERWSVKPSGATDLSETEAHQRARWSGGTALPADDHVDLGGI
jgi:Family of unknown function (DUF6603)